MPTTYAEPDIKNVKIYPYCPYAYGKLTISNDVHCSTNDNLYCSVGLEFSCACEEAYRGKAV